MNHNPYVVYGVDTKRNAQNGRIKSTSIDIILYEYTFDRKDSCRAKLHDWWLFRTCRKVVRADNERKSHPETQHGNNNSERSKIGTEVLYTDPIQWIVGTIAIAWDSKAKWASFGSVWTENDIGNSETTNRRHSRQQGQIRDKYVEIYHTLLQLYNQAFRWQRRSGHNTGDWQIKEM